MRLSYLGQSVMRRIIPLHLRPLPYLTRFAAKSTNNTVYAGPFKGMHYVPEAVGSALLPKLIGIYEREVAFLIEKACEAKPDLIVDIGAAEGYYAVGLAIRNPGIPVIAFEMEERGRELVYQMATMNNVASQITILPKCEAGDLKRAIAFAARPFVVCDVEGYERLLLDPVVVTELKNALILAEMHDLEGIKMIDLMRQRFSSSHGVLCIQAEERTDSEFPWKTFYRSIVPRVCVRNAMDEGRGPSMEWAWMEPKTTWTT